MQSGPFTAAELGEAEEEGGQSSTLPSNGVLALRTLLNLHIPIRGRLGSYIWLADWSLTPDSKPCRYAELPDDFRAMVEDARRSAKKQPPQEEGDTGQP